MKELIIRKAVLNDAELIILHTKKVLNENENLLGTSLEEFEISIVEEKEWISTHDENGLLLIAEVNGTIIGILSFQSSTRKKFRQNGMFGMSIQEAYTNQGVGSSLIKALLQWAEEDSTIEKIYLEVFANNKRAINLYSKFGFTEEGRKKNHVKLGPDEYVDEIIMSKFVK